MNINSLRKNLDVENSSIWFKEDHPTLLLKQFIYFLSINILCLCTKLNMCVKCFKFIKFVKFVKLVKIVKYIRQVQNCFQNNCGYRETRLLWCSQYFQNNCGYLLCEPKLSCSWYLRYIQEQICILWIQGELFNYLKTLFYLTNNYIESKKRRRRPPSPHLNTGYIFTEL